MTTPTDTLHLRVLRLRVADCVEQAHRIRDSFARVQWLKRFDKMLDAIDTELDAASPPGNGYAGERPERSDTELDAWDMADALAKEQLEDMP